MKRANWIALSLLVLLSTPAGAAKTTEKSAKPPRYEPQIVTIDSFDVEQGVMLTTSRWIGGRGTETVTIERDGKQTEQAVEVVTLVTNGGPTTGASTSAFSLLKLSGEKLPVEDFAKRLKPGTAVLLVEDGRPLDDFYRGFFPPGMLVLALGSDKLATYEYEKPHPTEPALELTKADIGSSDAYFLRESEKWRTAPLGDVDWDDRAAERMAAAPPAVVESDPVPPGEIGEATTIEVFEAEPVSGAGEGTWADRLGPKYATVESFDAKGPIVIAWNQWTVDEKLEAEAEKKRAAKEAERAKAAETATGESVEESPEDWLASYEPTTLFSRAVQVKIERDDLLVFDTAGKPLAADQIDKRLKKGMPVLYARDGRMLDKFYQPLFKGDALIVARKRDAEWVTYRAEKPFVEPGRLDTRPIDLDVEPAGPPSGPPALEDLDGDSESPAEETKSYRSTTIAASGSPLLIARVGTHGFSPCPCHPRSPVRAIRGRSPSASPRDRAAASTQPL